MIVCWNLIKEYFHRHDVYRGGCRWWSSPKSKNVGTELTLHVTCRRIIHNNVSPAITSCCFSNTHLRGRFPHQLSKMTLNTEGRRWFRLLQSREEKQKSKFVTNQFSLWNPWRQSDRIGFLCRNCRPPPHHSKRSPTWQKCFPLHQPVDSDCDTFYIQPRWFQPSFALSRSTT